MGDHDTIQKNVEDDTDKNRAVAVLRSEVVKTTRAGRTYVTAAGEPILVSSRPLVVFAVMQSRGVSYIVK